MNFQNLSFQYVEPPRHSSTRRPSHTRTAPSSDRPDSAVLGRRDVLENVPEEEYASLERASISPEPSVVRFAPSLSSYSSSRSSDNIYGPDRHFGRPLVPTVMANSTGPGQGQRSSQQPQFTPAQLQALAVAQHRQMNPILPTAGRPVEAFRDPLALEASRVTPGVDDTPYLQYAIEALTREREDTSSNQTSVTSNGQPYVPSGGGAYYTHRNAPITPTQPITSSPAARDPSGRQSEDQRAPLLAEASPRPASPRSSLSTLVRGQERGVTIPLKHQPGAESWEPVDPGLLSDGREKINPRLIFKPRILRTSSMITLAVLCILMLVALIFSAVYSQRNTGLWEYTGTIYSGQYFLFRVFPAILGALILFWAQCAVTTMLRLRPFARLAASSKAARRDAIFDELYTTSFLRPQLVGTWHIWAPNLITYLMNFTLPLLSCLYTVIYVDGHWRWATVQGVAWTLVALYVLLVVAVGIEMTYWLKDKTGVLWDPRSIADIAAIVANSNTLADYHKTEILDGRDKLKRILYRRRTDRLAYWGWADRDRPDELWYGLGYQEEFGDPSGDVELMDEKGRPQSHEKRMHPHHLEETDAWGDVELVGTAMQPGVRYRHIPFCLKDLPLIIFIIAGFILLLVVFIVSFIPTSRLPAKGFLPLVSSAPTAGAFSAADFLYSFIPALLGLVLFVAFQDLDLHLRILQPWGELSAPPAGGARAEASILADYAACYPLQAAWHALRNRHWRLAAISLLSTLFVLIPILAGGMFMALTPADGIVRVYPQNALFALTLTLCVLYWLALISLFPNRHALRLPHGVTCLAEIISYVANEDCVRDEAFQGMIRNKTSLVGKLGCERREADKPRWTLHIGGPGARDERLGVRRVRRFTERSPREGAEASLMGSPGRRLSSGGGGFGPGPLSPPMGTERDNRREARRSEREGVQVSPQYNFR
ncbi:hypothetical protein N0V82_010486 [Gnomoniopsis sp. IMI 355080]|nr:hypothetical protein N0V82_010486 [Gnomoniopsis sp. IMI 355080]